MTSKQLKELASQVYDININPNPNVMAMAMFELRDSLDAVIDHLYHRELERETRL